MQRVSPNYMIETTNFGKLYRPGLQLNKMKPENTEYKYKTGPERPELQEISRGNSR